MARVKEYDRERVLAKAVQVFWRKGYESTSVQDLVASTGLNTFSMYREFGGKESFFLSSMEAYFHSVLEKMLTTLREKPGMEGIVEFLDSFPPLVAARDYSGCLFMNTLTEKATISRRILSRVEEFCAQLTGLLEESIRIAQRKGAVNPRKDAAVLANLVLCFVQGLTLYGRISTDEGTIRGMVESLKESMRE